MHVRGVAKIMPCDFSLPDSPLTTDGRVNSKLRRAIERADIHLPDPFDWFDDLGTRRSRRKDERKCSR